jgi:hypothetical protein
MINTRSEENQEVRESILYCWLRAPMLFHHILGLFSQIKHMYTNNNSLCTPKPSQLLFRQWSYSQTYSQSVNAATEGRRKIVIRILYTSKCEILEQIHKTEMQKNWQHSATNKAKLPIYSVFNLRVRGRSEAREKRGKMKTQEERFKVP